MEEKEKGKFSKIINIIWNILFIPVLLIALCSSFLMYNAKKHNEVPSLFGYSSVVILSPSMLPEFEEGDYVMVKKADTNDLIIGDIIAFYEIVNAEYEDFSGTYTGDDLSADQNEAIPIGSFLGAGAYNEEQEQAAARGSRVIFHEIVGIENGTDSEGVPHRYFITKGTNNALNDPYRIKDTMVVGVYIQSSAAETFAKIFKFCSSQLGIILLVIIPAGIVLVMIANGIIHQAAAMKLDKKEEENIYKNMRSGLSTGGLKDDNNQNPYPYERPKEPPPAPKSRPTDNPLLPPEDMP